MAKHKVHVGIPYECKVACGANSYYEISFIRERVTCRLCRQSEQFKKLRNLPKAGKKRSKS